MIPNGWLNIPIGKICESIVPGRNKPSKFDGCIPWITTPSITRKYISSDDTDLFVSEKEIEKCGGKIVPQGAIIINCVGEFGIIGITEQELVINQQLHAFVCPESLSNEYIFYALSIQTRYMSKVATTTTISYMNKSSCESIPIFLPPLPEQRKIAEILGVWDDAIESLEQLITAKRKLKQGLMQQLLTGKKRFKEFEGSKWSMVKLSKVSTIRRGASPRPINDPKWFAETGRAWVRIRDVTASNTYLMEASQYLSELGVEKSVKVDPGDLIMSICATIGVPRILGIPACIHDGFVVFRNFEEHLDKFFLDHYINLITLKLLDSGQPGTQKNLITTIVGDIEVPQLSIDE